MGSLILILGGVRSGKSRLAERLAAAVPPVTYLATAQPGDAEMHQRIARHRQRRAGLLPPWETVEEPWDLPAVIGRPGTGTLLVECLPLWLTNRLVGLPGRPAQDDAAIQTDLEAVIQALEGAARRIILVSQEVGLGIIPANALARRFGDLLGEANQRLAARADEVHLCVAGLPIRLK